MKKPSKTLPAIAYTIVGTASDLEEVTQSEVIKYSAGGFRDFTRIAASDPKVWRDILRSNRQELLTQTRHFKAALAEFEAQLEADQGPALESLIDRASQVRAQWRLAAPRTAK